MDSLTQFLTSLLPTQTGGLTAWQALAAVFVAYAGGILSSLTPCVYPMIPITVGVVGGTGSKAHRDLKDVVARSLIYVAGMAMVYSFLGVLAGLTGRVFGSFTNTAGWYVALGLIMTAAALVMLDVVPFDPMVWMEQLKRKLRGSRSHASVHHHEHREMTFLGAFTLGASSGFIAAPCTTPVLTAILAYIAKTQSVGLGLVLMFSFALGLGTLLLLIATFTGFLQVLPRSGNWMKRIKILSGLVLLAFGEYLIYMAGSRGGPS